MIPLMLVLLMSAVPVALPVMFTVSMAIGSAELAKRGVLVTRLSASEDAATMDVLCVDKTGTITMNQLAVTGVIPLENAKEAEVLFAGTLASQEANQDPIDLAFLAAAKAHHVFVGVPAVSPVSFAPFDAENRRTEAVVEQNGQRLRVMKGAVRTVAEACGLEPQAIEALEVRVRESALKGYRTLAVARGPEAGAPGLVGLVTLYDPPRPDAKQLIAALNDLGVPVKMLTGDALAVACEIGKGVGLPNIRRAADLKAASAQDVDLLAGADGFAEVYPEDKYLVVQHLQAAGHVVGMTGDGVNDAPALRQAEVGIAVSTATDVAKGAASVVLTDQGLTDIVALVEQGRTIYQRVLTWIINKISRTILKSAFVAIAFVATGHFVVSAFAMLLLTFMTDFAKITLATDRVRPSRKPETWNIGGYITVSVVLGMAMVAEALLFLYLFWSRFNLAPIGEVKDKPLHTASFLLLLYFAVFSVVSARERRRFWATIPSKSLMAALTADALAGTVLALVGLPGLAPLPWEQMLTLFGYAMVSCLVVNDAVKVILIGRLVPTAAA
jgi:magnesium-transporting ATPase (P-type)